MTLNSYRTNQPDEISKAVFFSKDFTTLEGTYKLDFRKTVWLKSTDSLCSICYCVVLDHLQSAVIGFHYCAQHSSKQNLTELNLITQTN